ncbi:MAG: bifunctional pyr operon transcriptional regulator/uracil phosphoribosyltransferase PyrR [Coriobacteriia bacterium]|nr:bifunctional pyr operon transcriptional regulator/uracil phosphoribosyltransferase PyrR [Coriobacteriia bacterium]
MEETSTRKAGATSASADTEQVKSVCMEADEIKRATVRMAHQVIEQNGGVDNVVVVGIVSRGDVLACRLTDAIEQIKNVCLPLGRLDISFYRDDYTTYLAPQVESTEINFNIDGKDVVLVDDVLFTGRTIRAALDALRDIGRPRSVQLAVLVDRGHRQLPIRADYVGKNVPASREEQVSVFLREVDGSDEVQIRTLPAGARIGSEPVGSKGGSN